MVILCGPPHGSANMAFTWKPLRTRIRPRVCAALLLAGLTLAFGSGCMTESSRSGAKLDAQQAAELAAKLANAECEKLYSEHPFKADDHVPTFEEGRLHWGHLDPAGPQGLSADVTFLVDGSDPKVKVYLSSDKLGIPVRRRR